MKTYDFRYILYVEEIVQNSFFRIYVDGQLFNEISIVDHIVTFDVPSDKINDVKVELVCFQQLSFNVVTVILKQNFPMTWEEDKKGPFHFVYRPFNFSEIDRNHELNKPSSYEWLTYNILIHHESFVEPNAFNSWPWNTFCQNQIHDLSIKLQMIPDFTRRNTKWSYQNAKHFYYSYHVIILHPKLRSYAVCYHHKKQLVIRCFDSVEFHGDVFHLYKKNKKFPDIIKKTEHAPEDIFYVKKIYTHEDFAKFLSQSCQFINTCDMRANKFRYEN